MAERSLRRTTEREALESHISGANENGLSVSDGLEFRAR